MDFKDVIEYRRSVRKFADTPVTEEDIKKVVELARFAPSWKNTQTTRYTRFLIRSLRKNWQMRQCLILNSIKKLSRELL